MPGRQERVAAALRREIAELVLRGMRDPRLDKVTITAVEVSRDLAFAKVYISVLGEPEALREAVEAMTAAEGFVRRKIASLLRLRQVPSLEFRPDDSAARAQRLNAILDEESREFRDRADGDAE